MMRNSSSSELEKLVKMAEDVSETVNSLQAKIASFRVMFLVSVTGFYAALGCFYFIIKSPEWLTNLPSALYIGLMLLAVLLFSGSFFYTYKYIRNIRVYKENLRAEIKILHRLLDMVHEFKENLHDEEMTAVEKVILDMKLQRIKYSSKW